MWPHLGRGRYYNSSWWYSHANPPLGHIEYPSLLHHRRFFIIGQILETAGRLRPPARRHERPNRIVPFWHTLPSWLVKRRWRPPKPPDPWYFYRPLWSVHALTGNMCIAPYCVSPRYRMYGTPPGNIHPPSRNNRPPDFLSPSRDALHHLPIIASRLGERA